MQSQMQHLMQQIYFGSIRDTDDVSTYFYDQPSTFASRNPVILPEEGNSLRFVNIAELQGDNDLACRSSGQCDSAQR